MEKVDYTEIVFSFSPKDIDIAGDIANMAVKGGIYVEDYTNLEENVEQIAHIDLIDEELLKKDRSVAKIHIYLDETENPAETISYISEMYKANGIDFSVDSSICLYEDWAENWKKYFKPINIGNKLVIRPAWEPETADKSRTELILEPGMAFGTGTHETTRLCLELLSEYVGPDSEILDVGTGSGILAVAGVLLGAQKALGVDIDELSVKTAEQNAKLNGVDGKTEFICGNLTDKVSGKFNIVTANIVADVIIMLNNDILKFLDKDGIYIMSGIIDTRENDVLENLKGKFEVLKIIRERGWTAIAAKPL